MSAKQHRTIDLNVHLAGAIAYVPASDGALWALLPNGLVPMPARWRIEKEKNSQFLQARSTHLALLMTDHELVDQKRTSLEISSIIEPWNTSAKLFAKSLFPLSPSRKILSHTLGYDLDFGFKDDHLDIDDEVRNYFPKMKIIRPNHAWADKRFEPGSQGFDSKGLSSAVRMNRGRLSVGGFFSGAEMKELDFVHVVVDSGGDVKFEDPVWGKPVANHLIWTVPLEGNIKRIEITANPWDKDEKQKKLVLRVPQNRSSVDIAMLHSEPEIAALFIEDPFLAIGTVALPDPDFEIIHSVAIKHNKKSRLRVPVNKGGSAGGHEKPCTGGIYEGFK